MKEAWSLEQNDLANTSRSSTRLLAACTKLLWHNVGDTPATKLRLTQLRTQLLSKVVQDIKCILDILI